jgi:hypothetical protein
VNERSPVEVDRLASDLIELSTRHNFVHWLALGAILRRLGSASGDTAGGIPWIEDGIRDLQATGALLGLPSFPAVKAQAFAPRNRTPEALEVINEAEALTEDLSSEVPVPSCTYPAVCFSRLWPLTSPELRHRFCAAIKTAREQKSISLEKRSEAIYAAYRCQKSERVRIKRIPTTSLLTPKGEPQKIKREKLAGLGITPYNPFYDRQTYA